MSNLAFAVKLRLGGGARDIRGLLHNRQWWFFASLSAGAWLLGWVLFIALVQLAGVGPVRSQIILSLTMVPLHMCLNSLAITGNFRPSRRHALHWLAYWLPTASLNLFVLNELVHRESLWIFSGIVWIIVSRAVSGAVTTPVDFLMKKWVVFRKAASA